MLDIDTDTPCGICVEPKNENELFEAINQLMNNPVLMAKMAKNAREKALSQYNISNVMLQYINCYKSILHN